MKKFYFLGALSGLLLASCANDDLVVKPTPTTPVESGISFQTNVGNMSRATTLNAAGFDNFGVWAYKASAITDLNDVDNHKPELQVIPNYRVNYETTKYNGSNWTYVPAEWTDATLAAGYTQYLKYWDAAYTNTYFFGYAPHATTGVTLGITAAQATMTFPAFTVNANTTGNLLYAEVKKEINATHVSNPSTVALGFKRIFSQVEIAVWEDIPGYHVVMEPVTFRDQTTQSGVAAIPANLTITQDAGSGDLTYNWTKGSYLGSTTPLVIYPIASGAFAAGELAYTAASTADANLVFAVPAGAETTNYISENKTAPSPSATSYNVIPNPATVATGSGKVTMATGTLTPNSGLQFVLNFRLVSDDTEETILVKGARVYVPADYTAWEANKLYKYVFHITNKASGTTTDTDPDPDPVTPEDALYPIIFDNVTVTDLSTERTDWLVNGVVFTTTTLSLAPGETGTIAYESDGTIFWTTSDATVATVDNGVVTAVADGTCTITATASNGSVATCSVTVTTAAPAPSPKPAR